MQGDETDRSANQVRTAPVAPRTPAIEEDHSRSRDLTASPDLTRLPEFPESPESAAPLIASPPSHAPTHRANPSELGLHTRAAPDIPAWDTPPKHDMQQGRLHLDGDFQEAVPNGEAAALAESEDESPRPGVKEPHSSWWADAPQPLSEPWKPAAREPHKPASRFVRRVPAANPFSDLDEDESSPMHGTEIGQQQLGDWGLPREPEVPASPQQQQQQQPTFLQSAGPLQSGLQTLAEHSLAPVAEGPIDVLESSRPVSQGLKGLNSMGMDGTHPARNGLPHPIQYSEPTLMLQQLASEMSDEFEQPVDQNGHLEHESQAREPSPAHTAENAAAANDPCTTQ